MFGQKPWRPSGGQYQGMVQAGGGPAGQGGWQGQQYGGPGGGPPVQQGLLQQQPPPQTAQQQQQWRFGQSYANSRPPEAVQRFQQGYQNPGPSQAWQGQSGVAPAQEPAGPGPQQWGAQRTWQQNAGPASQHIPWQGEPGWKQQRPHAGPTPYSARPPQSTPTPDVRTWIGKVTQLIPPNYGIIDGNTFYVSPVVVGREPQVGESVSVEAVPNTDGGMYHWRCMRVEVAGIGHPSQAPPRVPPAQPAMSAAPYPQSQAQPMHPMSAPSSSYRVPNKMPIARGPPSSELRAARAVPIGASAVAPADADGQQQQGGTKYNQMAPPTNQYTAEIAMAVAQNAVDGSRAPGSQGVETGGSRRPFQQPGSQKEMDEEARRRSEDAVKGLTTYADNKGVGLKLLASMGYGSEGLGLGRNEQGIAAPVEAKEMMQGAGLGFQRRRPSPGREQSSHRDRPPPRRHGSPARGRSRSRERDRAYKCEPPKFPPAEAVRGIPQLSKRYKNLYIPSDFCRLTAHWVTSLPEHKPLDLTPNIGFNLGKMEDAEIEALSTPHEDSTPETEASTGQFWSARVVLLSGVQEEGLYQAEAKGWQSVRQKMQFLVGRKGKSEVMPIGCSWQPCDGVHPEQDPAVLVKTATRAVKEAIGLDLSSADTKWHKFVEFTYLRQADKKKGTGEHLEKCALFLVDPRPLAKPDSANIEALSVAKSAESNESAAGKALDAAEQAAKEAERVASEAGTKETPPEPSEEQAVEPSSLTVAQLQEELTKRNMDTKWNPLKGKKELVERLQERLDAKRRVRDKARQEYDEAQRAEKAAKEAVQREKDARETLKAAKAATKAAAKMLENPPPLATLDVKVNREFLGKKEKFGALVLSLDSLLRYTEDDTKESTFEISMFAELFQDMLDNRYGRGLLRSLAVIEGQIEQAHAEKAAEQAANTSADPVGEGEASNPGKAPNGQEEGPKDGAQLLAGVQAATLSPLAHAATSDVNLRDNKQEAAPQNHAPGAGAAPGADTEMADAPEARKSGLADSKRGENGIDETASRKIPNQESKRKAQGIEEPVAKKAKESGKETWKELAARARARKAAEKEEAAKSGAATRDKHSTEAEDGLEAQLAEATAEQAEDVTSHRRMTDSDWGCAGTGEGEPLFVACRWFDQECTGYIEGEDLEEIAFMVSDGISRKRVQTLVDSVVRRGRFSYGEHSSFRIPEAVPPLDFPLPGHLNSGSVNGLASRQGAAIERARQEAEARATALELELENSRSEQDLLADRVAELEAAVAEHGSQLEKAEATRVSCSGVVQTAASDLNATAASLQGVRSQLEALAESLGFVLL